MDTYNFNFEITKNLKMFESVFDDVIIKRFDNVTGTPKDAIKVNYLYGPKSRILNDLVNKPDTIKFPAVAVTCTGMGRDADRVMNKLQDIIYQDPVTKGYVNLRAIPWNINLQMTIMTKYQMDLDQIMQNFAVYTNPYIVYSWREPKSGREIRVEVEWDGQMSIDYPGGTSDLPANMPFRVMATTNFTIKTWLYRTTLTPVKPICFIYEDIVVTDNFYCDYDTLTAHTSASSMKDSYILKGKPTLRFVKPYDIEINTTPRITLQGSGFNNTFAVIVSANNPHMFRNTNYVLTSSNFSFNGQIVPNFSVDADNQLSFYPPAPSATGKFDIIAINPCGYGQLTIDCDRTGRDHNPYSPSSPYYNTWETLQYPYLSGINVYGSNFIPCTGGPIPSLIPPFIITEDQGYYVITEDGLFVIGE
jgi:hypothetical protein